MSLCYTSKNISLLTDHFKKTANVLPQYTLTQLSFDYLIGSNVLSHATSTKVSKVFLVCGPAENTLCYITRRSPDCSFPVPEHVLSDLEPSVVLFVIPVFVTFYA